MSTRTLHLPSNKISARQLDRESCHKGIEIPWGTKPQLWDSIDKLDTNRAEAFALCNGIIDSTLLNSNGNLEMRPVRRTGVGAWKWRLDLSEESSDAGDDVILVSLCVKGCNRDDNLEMTLEYAIGGYELLEQVVSLLMCLSLEVATTLFGMQMQHQTTSNWKSL